MSLRTLLGTLTLWLLIACQSTPSVSTEAAYRHIGLQIREERLAQGLSQEQLADEVGMSISSLSLIEDGLATPIHTKIMAIQDYLGLTFELGEEHQTIESYLSAAQKEQQ